MGHLSSTADEASPASRSVTTVTIGEVERGFGVRFWTVISATFLGFIGVGAILPQLGPHVRVDLGASDFTVGLIIGIFSVVALLSRFLSGAVTDQKGRKHAFLCGLGLCSLSGAFYWVPGGVTTVFLGRVLQGMGEAFLYTAAATWVIELAPDDKRARALGYLSTGIWGGICVGPAVGHALGSYQAAAALLLISPLPAMYALNKLVPDTFRVATGGRSYLAASKEVLMPGVALGLANVHYPAFTGFLALHLARYGAVGGRAFSAYAAMVVTSRFLLSGLPDKLGPKVTYYTGLSCMVVGLATLAAGPSAPIAVAAAALVGFGFSFPWPSLASVILGRVHETERASTLGVLTASIDLFVGLSALIHGGVASRLGYNAVFWLAAACAGASAIAGRTVMAQFTAQQVVETSRRPR